MNEILENEMILVKNLGNRIGYGNLMSWASALWKKELVDNGCSKELAELSVFVPVSIADVKDKRINEIKASESIYDSYVEEFIK